MKTMHKLTVNGETFVVADPDAAHINDNQIGQNAWSSRKITEDIDRRVSAAKEETINLLAPEVSQRGSAVSCYPLEGYPLSVVSHIHPLQAGSGAPSPDNVRSIQARTAVNLYRNGEEFTFPLNQTVAGGKNLLPCPYRTGSATVNGLKSVIADDGAVQFSGTPSSYANYHFVSGLSLDKGTYTFSVSGNFTATGMPFVLIQSQQAGVLASLTLSSKTDVTFSLEEALNDVDIYIYMDDAAFLSGTLYPQLEAGSVATAYEPYGTVSAVPAVYGGTLDWSAGILTLDKGILTFTGAEKWSYSIPKDHHCRIQHTSHSKFSKETRFCSHFVLYSGYSDNYTFPYMRANDGTGNWIYEGNQDSGYFASAEDFKAFLSEQYAAGTPVQVIYKMNTPVTVQLTPQEITALAGENTLYSDAGDITVTCKVYPQSVIEKLTNAIIALGGNI